METARYNIVGSSYIGVFGTASDDHLFIGQGAGKNAAEMVSKTLEVDAIPISISSSDLVGLFCRANSNGIVISMLALDSEIEHIKSLKLGLNVLVLESSLNAIGSNILANDSIAIINPDYTVEEERLIADALGVEVIRKETGDFKTVGANNILTNKGLVLNNRVRAIEQNELNRITGFDSVQSTANAGSLSIGLSTITNSNALVAGGETTGYELARMTEALE